MKILALDTATRKCGYALFQDGELVKSGTWVMSGDFDDRLAQLFHNVEEVGADVELVALEVPFVHPRMRKDTAIRLGQAVGVVKGWAFLRNIKTFDVYPTTAKKAMTGSGKATKYGVQEAVRAKFGLPDVLEDEADAIAVGVSALALFDKKA